MFRSPKTFTEQYEGRRDRGFRDIIRMHRDLIICAHQLDRRKFRLARQTLYKVLDVWPDYQQLSDRRIVPSFTIAPNSTFAILNLSGVSLRDLRETGGPGVVRM